MSQSKIQFQSQKTQLAKPWLRQLPCLVATLALSGLSALPVLSQTLSEKIVGMEKLLEQEFETYFGQDLAEVTQTPEEIAVTLQRIGKETGSKPAVLWVIPHEKFLHLVLITPGSKPIVKDFTEMPKATLLPIVAAFHREIYNSARGNKMTASQELYKWIVEPFEAEYLQAEGIDTILFCLGDGVRSLSLAALYDGKQFLLEKYSLTSIPAFNLIQTNYQSLKHGKILAMGQSKFKDQSPLPGVPTELSNILWELEKARPPKERWQGKSFLNKKFTVSRLQKMLSRESPNVVHLATHAAFLPGKPDDSYIQFWDKKLGLDELNKIKWSKPPLELLVLSACGTAIGDNQAELGFAGLALKSGVKSVVASLWSVNDLATLVLMSEFYRQLGKTSTKAEAIRQAQLRMLRGEVGMEGEQLRLSRGTLPLPEALRQSEKIDFSAPYYWAAFTMVSSPW